MNRADFISSLSQIFSQVDKISELKYEKMLKQFRNNIYDFLICRKNEDAYFNLDPYLNDPKYELMLHEILTDIQRIGWKTKLSFNDTGLFIFKENIPKTCW